MKSKLISVNNLKVSSENKKLVKGISFDLNRNEILGIIGESGSGKSLTALSILSLIKFKGLNQSGEIFYADELIDNHLSLYNQRFSQVLRIMLLPSYVGITLLATALIIP